MAVQYADTLYASMITVNATGEETTVALNNETSIYKVVLDDADTEIAFDTSALNIEAGQVISFELVVSMGATVQMVDFPAGVTWYDDIAPVLSAASKDYTLQFRSFDGGTSWVGGNQTSENNGRE